MLHTEPLKHDRYDEDAARLMSQSLITEISHPILQTEYSSRYFKEKRDTACMEVRHNIVFWNSSLIQKKTIEAHHNGQAAHTTIVLMHVDKE